MLPPTTQALFDPVHRPYFLWWTEMTVEQFKAKLKSADDLERAYYLGALLREANTRDVWVFTTPAAIAAHWALINRHLGKSRERWAFLLDLPLLKWPPTEAYETF